MVLLSFSLSLCCGCFPQTTLPVTPNPLSAAEAKTVTPEKDQPKRTLQAPTCVAFGNLELEAATEGQRPEAQRRDLYDMARKYFQQALKTDPKCRDAYLGLARAYQGLDNPERTVTIYQKAETVFPKDATFCYELGMYHARHREWGPALEQLKKAVDLDPDNRTYINMYGFGLARAGRYDESLAFFKKTVGEARAQYNVARMLHHANQDEASKQHLHEALEINPNLTEARQLLAEMDAPASRQNTTTTVSLENSQEAPKGVASPGKTAN
jgi:tetratricopeptide (TPR) repeat protein